MKVASLFVICTAVLVTATKEIPKSEYPIGISLGPTHLTAVYYNSSNDLVIIGNVEASPAYQTFHSSFTLTKSQTPCIYDSCSLGKKRQYAGEDNYAQRTFKFGPAINASEIEEIFTEAFLSIKSHCVEVLGEERRIASVVMPTEWRYDDELRKVIFKAEEKALGFIRPWWQTQDFVRMARAHYGVEDQWPKVWTEDEAWGEEMTWDEEEAWVDKIARGEEVAWGGEPTGREDVLVLVVEYEREYLRVKIVETARRMDDVLADELWVDLGEGSYNASLENSLAEKNYTMNLELALKNSVQELDIELLDGVIISGEASSAAQAHLQNALLRALPSLNKSKILNSTEPFYLGAAGAAHWSRHLYNNPETMFSGAGMTHCCLGIPREETCYYDTQEYADEIAEERREISEYFGFPVESWDESKLFPIF